MSHSAHHESAQLLSAQFDDLEQMCESVRAWDLDFEPLAAARSEARLGQIRQGRLGRIELGQARFSVSLEQRGAPPPGAYTFVVLEAGMKRLWWRGRDVAADQILVFPVGSELHCVSGADFEVFTLSVPADAAGAVCGRLGLALPQAHRCSEAFQAPTPLLATLRHRLRGLAEQGSAAVAHEAEHLVDELVLHWLGARRGRLPRRPSIRARDRAVERCLERMEEGDWQALSPSLLRDVAGVGERTLRYAFQERFGLPPAAFLKARRLAAVRRTLRQATERPVSVVDTAAELGFWHLGHFAGDYRRAFGEAPSETLRRARRQRQATPLQVAGDLSLGEALASEQVGSRRLRPRRGFPA